MYRVQQRAPHPGQVHLPTASVTLPVLFAVDLVHLLSHSSEPKLLSTVSAAVFAARPVCCLYSMLLPNARAAHPDASAAHLVPAHSTYTAPASQQVVSAIGLSASPKQRLFYLSDCLPEMKKHLHPAAALALP